MCCCFFFFFQAEDGIRDAQESRGLGDVYKRQLHIIISFVALFSTFITFLFVALAVQIACAYAKRNTYAFVDTVFIAGKIYHYWNGKVICLSLIHI
mgnify:CR=1 FL=1